MEIEPKRFKDLKEVCEGEKIRAQRLREFEYFGLIDVNAKRVNKMPVSFYKISEKGKIVLKLIDGMNKQTKAFE